MEDISATLERLALTFTVMDVMIPEHSLTCATNAQDASQLLIDNPYYDIIPIRNGDSIVGYLSRASNEIQKIIVSDLISDATSILSLVEILKEREFCFVLSGKRVAGYVHYSDLNNQVVKIPYFVILEAAERRIVNRIGDQITHDKLAKILSPSRLKFCNHRMKKLIQKNVDNGWINLLYFGEMVRAACNFGEIKLDAEQIKTITQVRNRVDHADRPMIRSHNDVNNLVQTRNICLDILETLR